MWNLESFLALLALLSLRDLFPLSLLSSPQLLSMLPSDCKGDMFPSSPLDSFHRLLHGICPMSSSLEEVSPGSASLVASGVCCCGSRSSVSGSFMGCISMLVPENSGAGEFFFGVLVVTFLLRFVISKPPLLLLL